MENSHFNVQCKQEFQVWAHLARDTESLCVCVCVCARTHV